MDHQDTIQQQTSHHHSRQASHQGEEHKDYIEGEFKARRSIWEELDMELHHLLDMLVSKFENKKSIKELLQEKPHDLRDESAISKWFDKLIHHCREADSEEEPNCVMDRGIAEEDVALKLERFKVKTLNGGNEIANMGDKKK